MSETMICASCGETITDGTHPHGCRTTAQQIADNLATLAGDQVPRTMPADAFDKHIKPKMIEAMLKGGLREMAEALEIYVDLFGDDHAGDPARSALTKLKGEKA